MDEHSYEPTFYRFSQNKSEILCDLSYGDYTSEMLNTRLLLLDKDKIKNPLEGQSWGKFTLKNRVAVLFPNMKHKSEKNV